MKPRYDPRVFLALRFSRTAQERMHSVQEELQQYLLSWHFLPDHQFHLTLRFFGELPVEQIARVTEQCRGIAEGLHTFPLTLNQVDYFGTPEQARVIFAGGEPSAGLNELVEAIEAAFPSPEAEQRRGFRPHVTLAKARKHMEPGLTRANANVLRRLRELGRLGSSQISLDMSTVHREFVLMETIWLGRRVEYEVREKFPLGE